MINLRRNVVPVINLAAKFGQNLQDANKHTCIIIMEVDIDDETVLMCVVVDKVFQVIEIPEDNIDQR